MSERVRSTGSLVRRSIAQPNNTSAIGAIATDAASLQRAVIENPSLAKRVQHIKQEQRGDENETLKGQTLDVLMTDEVRDYFLRQFDLLTAFVKLVNDIPRTVSANLKWQTALKRHVAKLRQTHTWIAELTEADVDRVIRCIAWHREIYMGITYGPASKFVRQDHRNLMQMQCSDAPVIHIKPKSVKQRRWLEGPPWLVRRVIVAVPSHGKGLELTFYYPERTADYALPKLAKKLMRIHGRKLPTAVLLEAAHTQGYIYPDTNIEVGIIGVRHERDVATLMDVHDWHSPKHPMRLGRERARGYVYKGDRP
jgi:hypothetical protein